MKSLIWKEWRETRWLTIVLLVLFLVSALCWKAVKPGDAQVIGPPIWTVLALFLGARTFAGEKQISTMEFLSAQPLRKAHLWAMKAVWGFGVVIPVVAISCLFDYMLMRADPFYSAFYLLELPLSWIVLALLAVYSVALLSSTICDKTVVALGLNIVVWPIIGVVIALIDRFHPHFFQLVNEWWGVPMALLWFSVVVLAGSYIIFAWREIWPNYPAVVKLGGAVAGGVTLILLLILSSANTPPERIASITWLSRPAHTPGGGSAAELVFSVSLEGRELPGWRIDLDGENFRKSLHPDFLRQRKHPAKNIVERRHSLYVANIVSGEYAGGCLVERIDRQLFPSAIPRRVRTTIRPMEGSSLSWLWVQQSVGGWRSFKDRFYFVEELPDGQKRLAIAQVEEEKIVRAARGGTIEAISPKRSAWIWSEPSEEGRVMLHTVAWRESSRDMGGALAEVDDEVRSTISFVTETIVQYELGGKMFLADCRHLGKPGFAVPQSVLSRGADALRRLADGLCKGELRMVRNLPTVAPVLESAAAGWGADVPEELFDETVFLVPWNRQIVYVKKENERQNSLWLLDVESGESKRILDDMDVNSPAVPEALVAPIMSDYFAFVRDTKTIWTYRDGTLKQIFPPQR